MKDYIISIFHRMGESSFQEAFWSNLLAGLIIAFMASLWINRATDFFKKPNLRLVVKQNGYYRDSILLSKRADGDYEASFRLAMRNDGNHTLRAGEGYWNTFILETEGKSPFSVLGEENHQRDLIRDAVYPQSFTDLGHEWKFKIQKEKLRDAEVPFFFSTDYGYFPQSVKMDSQTGKVQFLHMGKIGYELPEE
jgi:hypothetical protein